MGKIAIQRCQMYFLFGAAVHLDLRLVWQQDGHFKSSAHLTLELVTEACVLVRQVSVGWVVAGQFPASAIPFYNLLIICALSL